MCVCVTAKPVMCCDFWDSKNHKNDTIDNWDLMMLNAVKIWIKNPFSGCHNDISLKTHTEREYLREKEQETGPGRAHERTLSLTAVQIFWTLNIYIGLCMFAVLLSALSSYFS